MKPSSYKRQSGQRPMRPFKTGVVLAGGGARAAYQVGVLKAVAELLDRDEPNPFPVISGTSAGAINGAALAIYATQFHTGVQRLRYVWEHFHVHHVFRADALGVLRNSAWWLAALLTGGLGKYNPRSLLDRKPLHDLLTTRLPCEAIRYSIEQGALHAFGVTASGYSSGQSVTFYQGVDSIKPWQRVRRLGIADEITVDHLMASSALPLIFSAEKLHREYFGDGTMRQIAPLSPALHLGADRLLVIGVRVEQLPAFERAAGENYPSIAQIAGHSLNSIFLDSLEADLERLQRINNTVTMLGKVVDHNIPLRRVESLVISPSAPLDEIAAKYAHLLPKPVAFLFSGIGVYKRGGGNFLSYLLFEKEYCRELINLGYKDAMQRKEQLVSFLTDESYVSPDDD
ncbi:MAG: patatin-like phospholipase family protein [Pseudomonadota bacterium]